MCYAYAYHEGADWPLTPFPIYTDAATSTVTANDWLWQATVIVASYSSGEDVSTLSGSGSALPGSAPSLSPSSATNTAEPSSEPHLSSGAQIGIGVGVGLGGLLLLAVLVYYLVAKRRKTRETPQDNKQWDKAELHGDHLRKDQVAKELQSDTVHELPGTSMPVQADDSDMRVHEAP